MERRSEHTNVVELVPTKLAMLGLPESVGESNASSTSRPDEENVADEKTGAGGGTSVL